MTQKPNERQGAAKDRGRRPVIILWISAQIFPARARVADKQQRNKSRAQTQPPRVGERHPFAREQFRGSGDAEHAKPNDRINKPKRKEEKNQATHQRYTAE